MTPSTDPAEQDGSDVDGSRLLSTDEVGDLLAAAVQRAGGTLVSWRIDQIDTTPRHATTATYTAMVDWPSGRRAEMLGASARSGGRSAGDERAVIFADGEREVAVWLHPHDPELPGLPRATQAAPFAALLTEHRVLTGRWDRPVRPDQVQLEMIGYRPRRRAVLRATVQLGAGVWVGYVKVLRPALFADVLRRHDLLLAAGLPAPPVVAATSDSLLVLAQLPGTPLAHAIFDPEPPVRAEQLVALLDAMPAPIAELARRRPWSAALDQYAAMILAALPELEPQLSWLTGQIQTGLAGSAPGDEPTHGDFHEGQLFVDHGGISGVLDVDTAGPGRRADDLACLLAHLSTVQRMDKVQAARVQRLIRTWAPVFETRVDPTELRLRTAAVIVSLATGPYRAQEPDWRTETTAMVRRAEALVRALP
ncbi:MAG: aminoglycoside phosphotransferase family protein [Propionibacteriaceae bacterium]